MKKQNQNQNSNNQQPRRKETVMRNLIATLTVLVTATLPSGNAWAALDSGNLKAFEITETLNFKAMSTAKCLSDLDTPAENATKACKKISMDPTNPAIRDCKDKVNAEYERMAAKLPEKCGGGTTASPCDGVNLDHRTCKNVNGVAVFACKSGWENPPACDTKIVKTDPCDGVNLDHRTCKNVNGVAVFACKDGWKNPPECNTPAIKPPGTDPCNGVNLDHRTCKNVNGVAVFACKDGWKDPPACDTPVCKPEEELKDGKCVPLNPIWTWIENHPILSSLLGLVIVGLIAFLVFFLIGRRNRKVHCPKDRLHKKGLPGTYCECKAKYPPKPAQIQQGVANEPAKDDKSKDGIVTLAVLNAVIDKRFKEYERLGKDADGDVRTEIVWAINCLQNAFPDLLKKDRPTADKVKVSGDLVDEMKLLLEVLSNSKDGKKQ